MNGVIISLCDLTGAMVQPWVEAGYDAVLVDPQHGKYSNDGRIERLPCTVLEAACRLGEIIRGRRVVFVAGFPPCTDVAVSGARWFAAKAEADKHFQTKAALVAEQCRMVGQISGAPWFFENPVSVFSSIFGAPDYTFHPPRVHRLLRRRQLHQADLPVGRRWLRDAGRVQGYRPMRPGQPHPRSAARPRARQLPQRYAEGFRPGRVRGQRPAPAPAAASVGGRVNG